MGPGPFFKFNEGVATVEITGDFTILATFTDFAIEGMESYCHGFVLDSHEVEETDKVY